jgi:mannose-1-phosphate guanylyltransferase
MTNLGGEPVPKQFCALHGDVSMLRLALQRAARFVPETHLREVVAAEHRKWWEKELEDLPPPTVVAQPRDRGTAAGVLLPVTRVLRHDPEAVVVLLPADHHVEREWILQTAIHQGVAIVRADPGRVVLLGVTPQEDDDSELGWIVPSRRYLPFGPAAVDRFRDKFGAAEAASLRAQGALVNTFLLVALASTLRALYEELLPNVAAPFRRWRGGWQGLKKLYELIPSHDLSKDLLEPAISRLWVVPVAPCGWTDLGTPERVARCLRSNGKPPSPAPALLQPRPGFVVPLDLSRSPIATPAWETML